MIDLSTFSLAEGYVFIRDHSRIDDALAFLIYNYDLRRDGHVIAACHYLSFVNGPGQFKSVFLGEAFDSGRCRRLIIGKDQLKGNILFLKSIRQEPDLPGHSHTHRTSFGHEIIDLQGFDWLLSPGTNGPG